MRRMLDCGGRRSKGRKGKFPKRDLQARPGDLTEVGVFSKCSLRGAGRRGDDLHQGMKSAAVSLASHVAQLSRQGRSKLQLNADRTGLQSPKPYIFY